MSGKNSSFLSFNTSNTVYIYIIDSSATDHMTPHSSSFSSYTALSGNQHIIIANDSNILVTSCGNITSTFNILLKNVFHVPKLSNNLLSIHKVTQYLNFAMIFFFIPIVFSRILPWGRRLELLKRRAGYITYNMKIKSVSDGMHSLQLFSQTLNLGHPLKYGFNSNVLVILHLIP